MKTTLTVTCALAALHASLLAHGLESSSEKGSFDGDDQLWSSSRADSHAPIGVMGDHTHNAGEWMMSYRYMTMHMDGFYSGSSKTTNSMANTGYMMRPKEMDMDMQMLGIMYAPTDNLTLMAMTNYSSKTMTMLMGPMNVTVSPKMKSSGWGDTSLGGLYKFHDGNKARAHVGLSLSLPTGNHDETNAAGLDLPFPMQLGTGTYDLLPSITYLKQINDSWAWGAQLKARFHLGDNSRDFSYGDSQNLTTWVSKSIQDHSSISLRLAGLLWDSVDGNTSNSVGLGASPAQPQNSGGSRIDAFLGYNYLATSSSRLAIEFGKTIYQDLDGYQLGNDWSLQAGFQYAW